MTVSTGRAVRAGAFALVAAVALSAVAWNSASAAGTQVIRPAVGAVEATQAPVNVGSGTAWDGPGVAVIDSGTDSHTDYNLKQQVDCTGLGSGADGNGHGTGVAGTIAAYDDSKGMAGIAPGAPIYSVRVLDNKLKGSMTTLTCGLQWVLDNAAAKNIKVVNMSLATTGADDGNCGATNNDPLHALVCQLTAAGILVVASAGNESRDLAALVPASYDEVLTATNVVDYDGAPGGLGTVPSGCTATDPDDTYYYKSNFAVSAADKAHVLAAPGVCPWTTKKGNGFSYIQAGTSMSAAALSGVALNCYRPSGACVGKSVADAKATLIAQGAAAAQRGHTFLGDPTRPVAGKYFGYAASTVPVTGTTTPPTSTTTSTTTTPTTTPTTSTTTPTTTTPTTPTTPTTSTTTPTTSTTTSTTTTPTTSTTTTTPTTSTTTSTTTTPTTTTSTSTSTTTSTTSTTTSTTTTPTTTTTSTPAPDRTAPTAVITAPAANTTVSGTVTLTATATDNVGVTGVSFWVGTTKLGDGTQSGTTWSAAINSRTFPNGTYSVVAKAKDAAGNTGTSAAVKLIVKN
ncbi:S8 family serine peptidase [Nakamurella alba]|uniref:S8 family serine peptidase n=1 Tax=Nakamurella alba TaxID=2665158 RepID=UPI0018A97C2A|nr:S8 family serine peptidase [Nakamurella alba]